MSAWAPDFVAILEREVQAFETVAWQATAVDDAPIVPSCPDWTMSDLVAHLGWIHRWVTAIIRDRLAVPPEVSEVGFLALPSDVAGWPALSAAPNRGPLPISLVAWFGQGAADLVALFRDRDPAEPAWTWSAEQTVGFWLRVQAIEAAVHRWDAEGALGRQQPLDAALAADAVRHTFEVMAPHRRSVAEVPPGAGERYRFRQTDGPGSWTVLFEGNDIRLLDATERVDVELAGPASDLMLHLWHRIPADRLTVTGDRAVLDRYFTLVPPN